MSESLKVGFHLPRNYFASIAPKVDPSIPAASSSTWSSPLPPSQEYNWSIPTSYPQSPYYPQSPAKTNVVNNTNNSNFTSLPRSSIVVADPSVIRQQTLTPVAVDAIPKKVDVNNLTKSAKADIGLTTQVDVKNFKPPDQFCNSKRVFLVTLTVVTLLGSIVACATLSYLYFTQPVTESNYGESCVIRKCNRTRQLSCVDSICSCNEFELEYYNPTRLSCEKKSILQRNHGEECLVGTSKCLDGTTCIVSRCQCNSTTQYWNGTTCLNKKSVGIPCTNRNTTNVSPYYSSENCIDADECRECSSEGLLQCNSTTNLCDCYSSAYYYDYPLLKCMLMKSYFSYCTNSTQCDATLGLSCPTVLTSVGNCPSTSVVNRCDCASGKYWDSGLGMCYAQKDYYRPCSSDCECDPTKNLKCYNNLCSCAPPLWYDSAVLNCVAQKTFAQTCSNHLECRFDLGLTCFVNITGSCSCANPSRYFYSTTKQRCVECPAGWFLELVDTTYRCYLWVETRVRLSQADSICKSYGGYLATMETNIEYYVIIARGASQLRSWYWVGYYALTCSLNSWTWGYMYNGAASNLNLLPWLWYSNPSASFYTPYNENWDCSWAYILFDPVNQNCHNWPDRASPYINYPLCEMP